MTSRMLLASFLLLAAARCADAGNHLELAQVQLFGIDSVRWVAVAPDGRHAYLPSRVDNSVGVFHRDGTTGGLALVELDEDGVGGFDGLAGATAAAVSGDGAHVYVTSIGDSAVAVFGRDGTTGRLSLVEVDRNGSGGITGLEAPCGLALSPDDLNVYVSSDDNARLLVFRRDPPTGALAFVEVQGSGPIGTVGNPCSLLVSPDGAHVYRAAGNSGVQVFQRNAATGALTFVESQSSTGPIAISPDGAQLYAVNGDSIDVYSRDATTGSLTLVQTKTEVVPDPDPSNTPASVSWIGISSDGAHVFATGSRYAAVGNPNSLFAGEIAVLGRDATTGTLTSLEHVPGLLPRVLSMSPDGANLYVLKDNSSFGDFHAAYDAPGVQVFSRDAATGHPTLVQALGNEQAEGGAAAVSGDGRHVYRVGTSVVDVLDRDPATGRVTFVEEQAGGVGGVALWGLGRAAAMSADDAHLYVSGDLNAVVAFHRDSSTGQLTFVDVERDGVGGVNGLGNPRSIAIAPDGGHLYVAGAAANAISTFRRDAATGELTFVEALRNGDGGIAGLNGPFAIAVSPDGHNVYVSGGLGEGLLTFARDSVTGRLTFRDVRTGGQYSYAFGLAISPDGRQVYLATIHSVLADLMFTFDRDPLTGQLSQVQRISGGGEAQVIASPDGGHLYGGLVVYHRDVSIGRIDESNPDGEGPSTLGNAAISPDSAHLYLAVASGLSVWDHAPCTPAPRSGCLRPSAPMGAPLAVKRGTKETTQHLVWKWAPGSATTMADLGDPTTTTRYVLCVYDGSSTPLLGSATAQRCGRPLSPLPCWNAPTDGFKYVRSDKKPDGLSSILLKAGGTGAAKVSVSAGGQDLLLPHPPFTLPVTVQLQSSDGPCWESVYSSALLNDGMHFKARAD